MLKKKENVFYLSGYKYVGKRVRREVLPVEEVWNYIP
jgi:hypothetical protein